MAVCDLCKGTGRLLKPWYDTTGLMTGFTGDICFKCDGKGKIGEPMTNEEYLRSLNTEQLAEFMGDIWGRGYLTSHFEGNLEFGKKQDKAYWEMWLKQPHTVKE